MGSEWWSNSHLDIVYYIRYGQKPAQRWSLPHYSLYTKDNMMGFLVRTWTYIHIGRVVMPPLHERANSPLRMHRNLLF